MLGKIRRKRMILPEAAYMGEKCPPQITLREVEGGFIMTTQGQDQLGFNQDELVFGSLEDAQSFIQGWFKGGQDESE